MKNLRLTIFATSAAAVFTLLATVPALAMPVSTLAAPQGQARNVIQVNDRGHHSHHHFVSHRFHGRDDYYDRDDENGMLFKSFVTGTLFHDTGERGAYRAHTQ